MNDEGISPFVHYRIAEFIIAVLLGDGSERDEPDESLPAKQYHYGNESNFYNEE